MIVVRRPWLLSATLLLALPSLTMLPLHAADAPAVRMQDVDLRAFIQDVSRATGITFIVDTRVQGSSMWRVRRPCPKPTCWACCWRCCVRMA